jgi:hypothetical protein
MSSALRRNAVLGLAAALCLPVPALAATRRVAIIVGNNAGGPLDKPLHYAEEDATKVADVLAQLGDVHADDLLLLKGRGKKDSGHSDGDALELGQDRVLYPELRGWLRDTKADVRERPS